MVANTVYCSNDESYKDGNQTYLKKTADMMCHVKRMPENGLHRPLMKWTPPKL